MTNRKIQHQIEDISRYKYGLILPSHWVFRNKEKDYGIDGEVEIFDSKDRATGLVYWVQLKATQSKKETTIKSLDLTLESIKYYKSLEIPVLLVRYSTEEDEFYVKWAYEVDPFYAKKGAKKMRIKFTDTDKWRDDTASEIEKYLIKIRAVKKGSIGLPIPFQIAFNADTICEKNTGVLITKFRDEVKKYSEIVQIVISKDKALVDVNVDKSTLKVGILGLTGCTFHSVDLMDSSTFEIDLLKDMIIGMALATMQLGFNDLAARIIFSQDISERLKTKTEVIRYMVPGLLKTSHFEKTLEMISEVADKEEDNNLLEIIANSAVLFLRNRKQYLEVIENFMKRNVERNKKRDATLYGTSLYNLGNFYRSIDRMRDAVKHYLRARRYEPKYKNQEYYFGELAGALFHLEKYRYAAKCYSKAFSFAENKRWQSLYADALMYSGEYQQSLDVFNEYLSNSKDFHAEWQLKTICLEGIINEYGIKAQIRNKTAALSMADIIKDTDDVAEAKLGKALNMDMLCGLAWYNLGQIYSEKNEIEDASFCFLTCSLVQTGDIEAWVNATVTNFSKKGSPALLVLIVQAAYFFNREKYLEALYSLIDKQKNAKDILGKLSPVIEEIIAENLDDKSRPELRMLDKDGKFRNIFENEK